MRSQPLVTNWYLRDLRRRATTRSCTARPDGRRQSSIRSCCSWPCGRSWRAAPRRCCRAPDFSAWNHGHCPVCGWEPDFAVVAPSGDRRLICGRCVGAVDVRRRTPARSAPTTIARWSRRLRRATAATACTRCDVCRRYLKAYDARNAPRPVMVRWTRSRRCRSTRRRCSADTSGSHKGIGTKHGDATCAIG